MNNIKTILSLIIIFISLPIISNSQEKNNPKYKYYYSTSPTQETDNYIIYTDEVSTRTQYIFTKFRITNKTKKLLFFDSKNAEYEINNTKQATKRASKFIPPFETKKITLKVTDKRANFHVEKFKLTIKELQSYSFNKKEDSLILINYPAKPQDTIINNFLIKFTNNIYHSNHLEMKIHCQYLGDKVAFIDPSKLLIIQGRKKWENSSKSKKHRIKPNKIWKFKVSFVLTKKEIRANYKDMKLDFSNVISTPEPHSIEGFSQTYQFDSILTRNKKR